MVMRNNRASDVLHKLFRFTIGEDAVIETSPPPSRTIDVDPAKETEGQLGRTESQKEQSPPAANDDARLSLRVKEGVT
jgi:hypothetical protein